MNIGEIIKVNILNVCIIIDFFWVILFIKLFLLFIWKFLLGLLGDVNLVFSIYEKDGLG